MNKKPKESYIDIAAAIIGNDNSEFLIARRTHPKRFAGQWEFPGGKVEPNETPKACLVRKLEEELGIKVEIKEPFMVCEHDYGPPYPKKFRFHTYHYNILKGKLKPTVHDKLTWVSANKLLDYNFVEADIQLVERLIS